MAEIQKKFGARVKELRKRKNLTQELLAEKLDIGVRSLGKIETGAGFPSCETLEKMIVALDTDFTELFDFEHLRSEKDLRTSIIEMIDNNPEKISDIYKIVKALTL